MELLVLGAAMAAGLLTALAAAAARRRGSRAHALTVLAVVVALGYGLSAVGRVTSLLVLTLATATYGLTYVLGDIRWGVRPAPADEVERELEAAFVDGGGASQA
ncbi:hypothetical protein Cfla_0115 [Cellulomonas flavigena DSM 20109]|uniref:Uncharacterized protein n=1 Tax=Cellulomonas flavigena (strain ATCC 482 / DSM 20109 / BCRC 11376 / JCM 18109 / NBRC 3775 / NCIMB 8073 / NRS 134) TaxID=446466 RepID=D5UFS6_CELFN|nr:hypothetical protein [Cellulomonas flavigena]ADG73035.1 hypothetical protein Cfla_0115 [Cellulomonas flavigena DSM 20109]